MNSVVIMGLTIPFMGTALGAACVYLIRGEEMPVLLQKILLGFASGVMVAASVWSLLIPAMEECEDMGRLAFVPAVIGLLVGFLFLLTIDIVLPHLHINSDEPEGIHTQLKRSTMLVFAVTLHNLPEGMAVGVAIAACLSGETTITTAGALSLALGIAIQNFPEGAIISLPLKNELHSKTKSFLYGVVSGVVEPIGCALTILLTSFFTPFLPYLLAFAAGAMLYVVVEELLPEASEGEHSNIATIGFAIGFALMMVLDVALG
ncbi:MAG: ZIP family metal transporter [Lachnospiraceae bacterium]|nr:ZIP family metal transporter [Lachnospiraceae bacterium]